MEGPYIYRFFNACCFGDKKCGRQIHLSITLNRRTLSFFLNSRKPTLQELNNHPPKMLLHTLVVAAALLVGVFVLSIAYSFCILIELITFGSLLIYLGNEKHHY